MVRRWDIKGTFNAHNYLPIDILAVGAGRVDVKASHVACLGIELFIPGFTV
jgi:hypothetical protein